MGSNVLATAIEFQYSSPLQARSLCLPLPHQPNYVFSILEFLLSTAQHCTPLACSSSPWADDESLVGMSAQVEAVSRVLRRLAPPDSEIPQALRVATETILLTGIRQYPDSALLHVSMGNYRMHITKDVQSATSSADRATILARGLAERAMCFWLELEVLSKTVNDGGGAENTMDLAACDPWPSLRLATSRASRNSLLRA